MNHLYRIVPFLFFAAVLYIVRAAVIVMLAYAKEMLK